MHVHTGNKGPRYKSVHYPGSSLYKVALQSKSDQNIKIFPLLVSTTNILPFTLVMSNYILFFGQLFFFVSFSCIVRHILDSTLQI